MDIIHPFTQKEFRGKHNIKEKQFPSYVEHLRSSSPLTHSARKLAVSCRKRDCKSDGAVKESLCDLHA